MWDYGVRRVVGQPNYSRHRYPQFWIRCCGSRDSVFFTILISIVSAILNLWISGQGRIEMVTRTQTGRKIRHIN
jgi:hypothetical protein